MARKGVRTEEQYDYILLDLLPYDPPGLTWKNLSTGAKQAGIASKGTVSSHLKTLANAGLVLHEGRFYRRNPTHSLVLAKSPDRKYRKVGESRKPYDAWRFGKDSKRLSEIYSWSDDLGTYADMDTLDKAMFQIRAQFARVFVQYVLLLQDLVKISDKNTAREYADLVRKVEIDPHFVLMAHGVWKNRSKIRIQDIDYKQALKDFVNFVGVTN